MEDSVQDSENKQERHRKHKKSKKRQKTKKHKKVKKKKKKADYVNSSERLSTEAGDSRKERVKAAAEARLNAGLGWMCTPQTEIQLKKGAKDTGNSETKEDVATQQPKRPYGLYDPKKQQPFESECMKYEEVDEFGRMKRPRNESHLKGETQELRPTHNKRDEMKPEGVITATDLNKLVAQALKAKLRGDSKQYQKLTEEVKQLKLALDNSTHRRESKQVSLLSTDKAERISKVPKIDLVEKSGDLKGYFRSDIEESKKTIQELLASEKLSSTDDLETNYVENMLKKGAKFKDPMLQGRGIEDEDIDVSLYERSNNKMTLAKLEAYKIAKQERERDHLNRAEATSPFSLANPNFKKSLLISLGSHAFLMLPVVPITEGHCRIVPVEPLVSLNGASEGLIEEIRKFKQGLEAMFLKNEQSVVYLETVMNPKKLGWHTFLECIPVDEDLAEIIPMYFKKALLDSDTEWATHKKIIDTSNKPIQRAIPAGFPYFHVEWAGGGYRGGGYAHVIEDKTKFSSNFGIDILCGAMGQNPSQFDRKILGIEAEK